jgi:hypothetical protein
MSDFACREGAHTNDWLPQVLNNSRIKAFNIWHFENDFTLKADEYAKTPISTIRPWSNRLNIEFSAVKSV